MVWGCHHFLYIWYKVCCRIFMTTFKCLSVTDARNKFFLTFIIEKVCSQIYEEAKIQSIFLAKGWTLVYLFELREQQNLQISSWWCNPFIAGSIIFSWILLGTLSILTQNGFRTVDKTFKFQGNCQICWKFFI